MQISLKLKRNLEKQTIWQQCRKEVTFNFFTFILLLYFLNNVHRPAHDPQCRSCCLIFTAKVEKFKLSENSVIFCSILNKIIAISPF